MEPRKLPLSPCSVRSPFEGHGCTAHAGLVTSGRCAECRKPVCESCSTRRNWGARGHRWRKRVCRTCQEQHGLLRRRHPSENPVELTPEMLRGFLKVADAVEARGIALLGHQTEFTERAWVRFGEFTAWARHELKTRGAQ